MPKRKPKETVPISVPKQSSKSEADTYGYDGEAIHHPDYSVVVPVVSDLFDSSTGINARRFLQTAIALADDNDGRVVLLGIATVNDETEIEQVRESAQAADGADEKERSVPDVVTERQTQLAQIVSVAEDINQDVSVRAVVRVVTDTTQGILDALGSESETAVLLLRGTGFDEGWLLGKSTIDTVVDEAECDVFVENVGVREGTRALYVPNVDGHSVASLAESEAETIESVLLPVGTGPHAALASEAARAVARAFDASVTILHVISPDASGKERSDAKNLLTFAEYVLGPEVDSETELSEAPNPTEVIIEAAKKHDFTSIGSPEQKFKLRDLVFKPIQETLVGRQDVTVLMGRDADRTMRSLYYRYTQAMDASDADEQPE
ncbi:universal stress protein [Haloferax sp. ATB1]|uniref:universal stress protein n=1 Tax=Haloferax sp. ATB1 TaxID=1508454 RepID=UPI0005B2028E|nr:universal stress protein [Haloferax sp. ATB1]